MKRGFIILQLIGTLPISIQAQYVSVHSVADSRLKMTFRCFSEQNTEDNCILTYRQTGHNQLGGAGCWLCQFEADEGGMSEDWYDRWGHNHASLGPLGTSYKEGQSGWLNDKRSSIPGWYNDQGSHCPQDCRWPPASRMSYRRKVRLWLIIV